MSTSTQRVIRAISDAEAEQMVEAAMDQAVTVRWFTREATPLLLEHVQKMVEHATAPLLARIAELESRQQQLRYVGVWNASRSYSPGNFCTHAGALWHAEREVTGIRPGTSSDWVLAVKSGQPGRSTGVAKDRAP